MSKRHKWSRGSGWCWCIYCGCRYRTGMVYNREYEQPDGRRTINAESCVPRKAIEPLAACVESTQE